VDSVIYGILIPILKLLILKEFQVHTLEVIMTNRYDTSVTIQKFW